MDTRGDEDVDEANGANREYDELVAGILAKGFEETVTWRTMARVAVGLEDG